MPYTQPNTLHYSALEISIITLLVFALLVFIFNFVENVVKHTVCRLQLIANRVDFVAGVEHQVDVIGQLFIRGFEHLASLHGRQVADKQCRIIHSDSFYRPTPCIESAILQYLGAILIQKTFSQDSPRFQLLYRRLIQQPKEQHHISFLIGLTIQPFG